MDLNSRTAAPIDPRPWRHLVGWLRRRSVDAEGVVPARWLVGMKNDRDLWKERFTEAQERINATVRAHRPAVHKGACLDYTASALTVELVCKECSTPWPCSTWTTVTGTNYEAARLELVKRERNEKRRDA